MQHLTLNGDDQRVIGDIATKLLHNGNGELSMRLLDVMSTAEARAEATQEDGESSESPRMWTVIGYYEDNEQAWADSYEAADYEEAQAKAHAAHPESNYDADDWSNPDHPEHDEHIGPIVITGVIEGSHAVFGGDNEHV